MEELLMNDELYNNVYQKLFNTFLFGITKKHKREYFSFSIGKKTISGRAILPNGITVNEKNVEIRAFEIFRLSYPEIKFYSCPLIKKYFPEMFEDIYQDILKEDMQSEKEFILDKLVDEVLKSKLK